MKVSKVKQFNESIMMHNSITGTDYTMQDVCDIFDRVRSMAISEPIYHSTGDEQLDLAFMLSRNEIKFLTAYAKSDSAFRVLNNIIADLSVYQMSFTNTDIDTSAVYMADEIVLSVYEILNKYGLHMLDTVEHTFDQLKACDIQTQKLSKSLVHYGEMPKMKECIVSAVEYIDKAISDVIRNEKNAVDLSSDRIYEKHEIDDETCYYEAKPCDSVFSSPYAVTLAKQGLSISLTEDIETQEAFTVFCERCGLTDSEARAVRLYFLHGMSITAIQRNWTDSFNSSKSKAPASRIKKYLASAIDKVCLAYGNCVFTSDKCYNLAYTGIGNIMKMPIFQYQD